MKSLKIVRIKENNLICNNYDTFNRNTQCQIQLKCEIHPRLLSLNILGFNFWNIKMNLLLHKYTFGELVKINGVLLYNETYHTLRCSPAPLLYEHRFVFTQSRYVYFLISSLSLAEFKKDFYIDLW